MLQDEKGAKDWVVPGLKEFKTILNDKPKVSMPEHVTDHDEFPDEPEANTPDGLIPGSWLKEDGTRQIIVWDLDFEKRYKLVDNHILVEQEVF